MAKSKEDKKKYITVTQTASLITCSSSQRKTLIGLGLTKLGKSKNLEDTPSIQGMIKKVKHLISVKSI